MEAQQQVNGHGANGYVKADKDAINMTSSSALLSNGSSKQPSWDVISESYKLLQTGILSNPLIAPSLPPDAAKYASKITFTGHSSPSIAIPWRFGESVASLKALESIMISGLLNVKYGIPAQEVEINVDHAHLYVMSAMLTTVLLPDGNLSAPMSVNPAVLKYFPSDNFHLHGSMNPDIIMEAVGMPGDVEEEEDWEASAMRYQNLLLKNGYTAEELQRISSEETKQAGTICWSIDEFKESEHGKANAHVGLWETHHRENKAQQAGWWKESPQTGPARPLAGLKVVDMTRIIAAPAVTRGLAELGASIMRITAPHIQDMGTLHPDLGWGKWNCSLDFRKPADLEEAKALIMDADIVVSGYRPAVLDKYGLGETGILELTKTRERGIIFARENCYGWNGPWQGRSGWQQISDACCGVSLEFGRAMGNEEAVTPVFPNSDYCTGIAGVCAILDALMQRAEKGGSYTVDIALNYYSQWLVNSVGMYPKDVWEDVWERNGKIVVRHYYPMGRLLPMYFEMLQKSSPYLFNDEFFEIREAKAVGAKVRTVKPIVKWKSGVVKPGFQVSARRNGIDQAKWPEDLTVERVD